jgi:precorrin-6B methylase 1
MRAIALLAKCYALIGSRRALEMAGGRRPNCDLFSGSQAASLPLTERRAATTLSLSRERRRVAILAAGKSSWYWQTAQVNLDK